MTLLNTDVYILSEKLNSTLLWGIVAVYCTKEYSKQLIHNAKMVLHHLLEHSCNKQDDCHYSLIYTEPNP